MKRITSFATILFTSFTVLFSNISSKEIPAGIDRVTVFYQGAQIERSSKSFNLEKGQTLLLIKGLEQHLQEQSLRVGLKGEGKILSVVKRMDYLQKQEAGEKIGALEGRLKLISMEKEDLQVDNKVYEQERNLLMSNMKLGGEQQGVQISELKEAADFYRSRLNQVESHLMENIRRLKILDLEIVSIQRQMQELNYQKNKPSSTIEVTVEALSVITVRIALDYYVPVAGWAPQYDIRVDGVGKPVSFVRKAVLTQSTGVDWNDIRITFSTGNPQEHASKPTLSPWYLRQVYPQPISRKKSMKRVSTAAMAPASQAAPDAMEEILIDDNMEMDFSASIPEVQVAAKNSLLEFTIASSATVPSDNKEYTLSIGTFEVEADYEFHTVPKLDPTVYLMAIVPDWDSYDLISGSANLYYEGMYVGETYINASSILDSLQISLGKDRDISVERRQVTDFSSDQIIGMNQKMEFGFRNIIRNSKSETVKVFVEDQFPVSSLKDVEVDHKDHGTGILEKQTGKVIWKVDIKPGETVELPLEYSVKFPRGMQINL